MSGASTRACTSFGFDAGGADVSDPGDGALCPDCVPAPLDPGLGDAPAWANWTDVGSFESGTTGPVASEARITGAGVGHPQLPTILLSAAFTRP
jgi:hypothetical protein